MFDIFEWDQVPSSYIENESESSKWYEYRPFVSTKNPLQRWGRSRMPGIASVEDSSGREASGEETKSGGKDGSSPNKRGCC